MQNHLFQILSIMAMERPDSFTAKGLHDAQQKVLRRLTPATPETIADTLVLGQYEGYRTEPLVAPDSQTETFAASGSSSTIRAGRGRPSTSAPAKDRHPPD